MVDKITQAILDDLTAKAKASPRLRMNLDLRNSAEDKSQRMLNAIEPGSVLPIHRHQKTSETVVCLRGKLVILVKTVKQLYDECRRMPGSIDMKNQVERLGMNYSALYELNSDIVNFCIKMPKDLEMKALMAKAAEALNK